MRIGIDCRFYSSKFTGIGRYTFELVKNLLKIDKQNEYVLFFNEPEFSEFQKYNLKAKILNCTAVLANAKHYSFAEQSTFLKKLYNAKLDLMHFTHFNAPIFYIGKSIVTIHDLTPSFFPGKKFNKLHYKLAYNLVLKSAIKKAKKIIAVSKNTACDIENFFPKAKNKISVIYESVAEEFVNSTQISKSEIQKKYQIKDDFLLYTGVWRDHKNLVGLIEAFQRLKKEKAFSGQLVITGKEDPYYPEVKETVKKFKLHNDVIFSGLVPETDLIALYQAAKLYVFPSFYEGFGLPILEAFASKTPLVCSNSSCLPEIAGDNNALFFDPNDIEEMSKQIWKLWNDKKLQKELINNGQKRLGDFSWDKMGRETLEIYQF